MLGLGFAYLSQAALSTGSRSLALPPWIMFYGSAAGLLFAIAVKSLFPAVGDRQAGATAPALWLKYVAEPLRIPPETGWIVKALTIVLTIAFVARQVLGDSALAGYLAGISVMLLIFREVRRRW